MQKTETSGQPLLQAEHEFATSLSNENLIVETVFLPMTG
ncbi:hypothetical Protein YC6258_03118 [Gynuella sunshinyii YC6258]|uniref:Uncharacterized protein n=1 Tax=Gynuella sunshinyii YC6258 TaxID=1445510 RepID=A0A0C5VXL2_9GAMM|nr:hypothetical Protein YC6258_03118 [Gynuella sunshinyii YC6258]